VHHLLHAVTLPCGAAPARPVPPLAGALSFVVLPAVIGRDLGPQRAAQPVNPGLDLLSRVAILMREHRTQIGEQAAHDPHGPARVTRSAVRLSWRNWASAWNNTSLWARCAGVSWARHSPGNGARGGAVRRARVERLRSASIYLLYLLT
jgi:hypothetical protein